MSPDTLQTFLREEQPDELYRDLTSDETGHSHVDNDIDLVFFSQSHLARLGSLHSNTSSSI